MNTDLATRVRGYIASLHVPDPPPFTIQAPRRGRRLTSLVPIAAAMAVAAVLLVGLVPWGATGPAQPAAGAPRPSLPDRWARYNHFTGYVSQSPPGTAIAVYQHGFGVEFLDFPQGLVLSAYTDKYRRVDLADDREDRQDQGAPAPMLLSPDGTRLAVGSHDGLGELALLDLTSGRVSTVLAAAEGRAVRPLAWSRNGRYIAALELAASASNQTGSGPLVIFDLATREVNRYPQHQDVSTAAFSPNSDELAIQGGTPDAFMPGSNGIKVIGLDGQTRRVLSTEGALTSESAWSPDGMVIATVTRRDRSYAVVFLDATGQGRDVPDDISPAAHNAVLGWTGDDRVLLRMQQTPTRTDNRFVEVNVRSRQERVVSEFDSGPDDGFSLGPLQFASNLLLDIRTHGAGDPDRGPLPTWMQFTMTISLLGAAVVLFAIIGRRRARLRLPRPRDLVQRYPRGAPST